MSTSDNIAAALFNSTPGPAVSMPDTSTKPQHNDDNEQNKLANMLDRATDGANAEANNLITQCNKYTNSPMPEPAPMPSATPDPTPIAGSAPTPGMGR